MPKTTPEQDEIKKLNARVEKLEKIISQLIPAQKKLVNTCTKLKREVKSLNSDLQRSNKSLSQEIERKIRRY